VLKELPDDSVIRATAIGGHIEPTLALCPNTGRRSLKLLPGLGWRGMLANQTVHYRAQDMRTRLYGSNGCLCRCMAFGSLNVYPRQELYQDDLLMYYDFLFELLRPRKKENDWGYSSEWSLPTHPIP
jgi:hypothetical protein